MEALRWAELDNASTELYNGSTELYNGSTELYNGRTELYNDSTLFYYLSVLFRLCEVVWRRGLDSGGPPVGKRGAHGPFCGAAHQVTHRRESADELEIQGEDGRTHRFAFATMCRSDFFPVGMHNRLRSRRGSPLALWNMLAAEIPNWLKDEVSAGRFRLPTEAECISMQPP